MAMRKRGSAMAVPQQQIGKDAEIERLNAELAEHQKLKRHLLELLDHKDAEIRDYMDKMAELTSSAAVNEARLQEIELELIRYHATHNEDSEMKIFVKDLLGRTYSLKVGATDTIDTIKAMIQYKTGLPRDDQRIIFSGKQLEGGRCVRDSNITDGCTVHLVQCLRGC